MTRNKHLQIRVSEAEKKQIEANAESHGLKTGDYLRTAGLFISAMPERAPIVPGQGSGLKSPRELRESVVLAEAEPAAPEVPVQEVEFTWEMKNRVKKLTDLGFTENEAKQKVRDENE